ncbi:MAG: hypothetical protein AB7U85_10210 [Alphaproteobacteria bacterium]
MQIHIFSHTKGGVGKTYIAYLLAQYYASKKLDTIIIDADPVNESLFGFKGLNVKALNLMENHKIDMEKLKLLFENLPNADKMIIDIGMSLVLPFYKYMAEGNVIKALEEQGHEVLLHSIITNGSEQESSVKGLQMLSDKFADSKIMVWLNNFLGARKLKPDEIAILNDLKAKDRICNYAILPDAFAIDRQNNKTILSDNLNKLLAEKLTFNEASDCQSLDYPAIEKLLEFKKLNYQVIESVNL